MQKLLFHYTLAGILFVAVTGTIFHFIYEWSGNNTLAGLFVPVSESTWEHMKMLFFPMLFYSIFEYFRLKNIYPNIWCANTAGILSGTFLIPLIFYTYTSLLGFNILLLDIAVFVISIISAFLISCLLLKQAITKKYCFLFSCCILLLAAGFFIFTFHPPDLGLFRIPS